MKNIQRHHTHTHAHNKMIIKNIQRHHTHIHNKLVVSIVGITFSLFNWGTGMGKE